MKARFPEIAASCALLLLGACSRAGGRPPVLLPVADAGGGVLQEAGVFQSGVASWYGDDFHGKTTADGEVYDMHKLTAAHPELPFHTLVEVENLENGRRVLVRINDRGPFLKGRIIDLSLAAASRLGMTERGTAEVQLRVRRWGSQSPRDGPVGSQSTRDVPVGSQSTRDVPVGDQSPRDGPMGSQVPRTGPPPAAEPTPAPDQVPAGEAEEGCVVQAGAFAVRENAEDLLLTLEEIFPGTAFRVIEEDGLFKVVSPALETRAECQRMLETLSAYKLQGFLRPAAPAAGE